MADKISIIQKALARPAAPVKSNTIQRIMAYQQSLALLHWRTSSYAEHKALGEAYEKLADLLDGFVESLIGLRSRSILAGIGNLQLSQSVDEVLGGLESIFRNDLSAELTPRETSLLNIRDEMLDLVLHTRYLLTLK